MRFVDAQFYGILCQVLYRHAEIISGAYKFRQVQQGCEKTKDNPSGWRDLTDEEKLVSSLQTMQAQIHRLTDLQDYIAAEEKNE